MNDNKNVKRIVVTKKIKEDELNDFIEEEKVSQSLDEHLKENINNQEKKKINWMNILTYFIMIVIVIACLALIYIFLDKNGINPFKEKETTTTIDVRYISTTTSTTPEVRYIEPETTTKPEVRTVYGGENKGVPSSGGGSYDWHRVTSSTVSR